MTWLFWFQLGRKIIADY